MAAEQANAELQHKARISVTHAKTPMEKLQALMLSRGASCFKTFRRRFLIMDDDGSKKLSYDEFKYGLRDIGLKLSEDEMRTFFNTFDKDNSGSVDMTEFTTTLRPTMKPCRQKIVDACFMWMDKTGDGKITFEDLVDRYNASCHPKYISGEWTETKVLQEFLKTFEAEHHADGMVTKDEFTSYYACLSASIDLDAYFSLMMRNSWKHLNKDGKFF